VDAAIEENGDAVPRPEAAGAVGLDEAGRDRRQLGVTAAAVREAGFFDGETVGAASGG
jgi:hypothetical protein